MGLKVGHEAGFVYVVVVCCVLFPGPPCLCLYCVLA